MSKINISQFQVDTKIISGAKACGVIADEVKRLSAKSTFVISDPVIDSLGLGSEIFNALEGIGAHNEQFNEIEPNPRDKTVEKMVLNLEKEKIDLIIALGGGSVIDAAKAFAALYSFGGKCLDYEGEGKVSGKALPIIAIPTTAGTGSEVTCWSVLTAEHGNRPPYKFGIGSEYLMPIVAVLDPELTLSLPPQLTAATGVDALTHAVEAYTSKAANLFTDALALEAIKIIAEYLPKVVADPGYLAGRHYLLQASTMAGIAFNIADLGAVHSMSEAVGGLYDLGHGLSNAIILPHVINYNYSAAPGRYSRIAGLFEDNNKDSCAEVIYNFIRDLGLPLTLKEVGLTELDLEILSELAFENSSTCFNPKPADVDDFKELFKKVL